MAVYYHPSSMSTADGLQTQCLGNITPYVKQASSAGSYLEVQTGGAEFPPIESRTGMLFVPPTSETDGSQMDGKLSGTGCNILDDSITTERSCFQGQGLSLSLGTQIQTMGSIPSYGIDNEAPRKVSWCHPLSSATLQEIDSGIYHLGRMGLVGSILHSKYLRPTQQLLDELVNIRKASKEKGRNRGGESFPGFGECKETSGSDGDAAPELTPSDRQALLNNKSQLLTMLDEVDKRYSEYYHQVQALASSFETVAGFGAAKAYISVALQRISRHFRSLRDAIKSQIQIMRKRLGEQDELDSQVERLPRLRYVDHQLRQQKAIQQFGVIRPAWRPQRGLPESSVSILRAWLFEHFLHPYPKESEKLILAKQTGLTKNQVANWFINARVRLWKPMIEKMYREEFGESEADSNSPRGNMPNDPTENSGASEAKAKDLQESLTSSSAIDAKAPNTTHVQNADPHSSLHRIMLQHQNFQTGSSLPGPGAHDMSAVTGSVFPNTQVSLALGLHHGEEVDIFASSMRSNAVDDYHRYFLVMGNHQVNDSVT